MLRNALLFENVPAAELEQLCSLIRTVDLEAAETFVARGDPSPGLVLVEAGTLDVLVDATPICSLSPGSVFSEESLVSDAPSAATLRAAAPARIGVLERRAVDEQLERMPLVWEALDRAWRHRVLAGRLYALDLFEGLPADARFALAAAFETVDLLPGATLVRQGQLLECLFVIREGQAELHLPGHDPDVLVLRPGDSVGARALVGDAPEPGTVTAPSGLRAMRLSRPALKTALAPFPGALDALERAAVRSPARAP